MYGIGTASHWGNLHIPYNDNLPCRDLQTHDCQRKRNMFYLLQARNISPKTHRNHGRIRNWFHKTLFGSYSSQEKSRRELVKAEKTHKKEEVIRDQIDFFDNTAKEIADELARMDVTTFTPIEAMNKLYELANKAKNV